MLQLFSWCVSSTFYEPSPWLGYHIVTNLLLSNPSIGNLNHCVASIAFCRLACFCVLFFSPLFELASYAHALFYPLGIPGGLIYFYKNKKLPLINIVCFSSYLTISCVEAGHENTKNLNLNNTIIPHPPCQSGAGTGRGNRRERFVPILDIIFTWVV